jgi:hypothetical protein
MLKLRSQIFLILIIVSFSACVNFGHAEDGQNVSKQMTRNKEFSLSVGTPFQDDVMKEPSKGSIGSKNVLLSLILPGLGEWVAGEKGRAKIFMSLELGLWISYFGIREYANVLERNYLTYAAVHAGVDTRGKTKQYWIDIGNANNIYDFNERRRIDRNLEATYPETEKYFWQWDSEGNRIEYSDLRDKQDNWKQIGTFMIGGMILNRIVSAIDIIRLVRRSKKVSSGSLESGQERRYSYLHWSYHQNRLHGDVVQLNFTWNF